MSDHSTWAALRKQKEKEKTEPSPEPTPTPEPAPTGAEQNIDSGSDRREGHSALRVEDGKLEKFDPHPAGDEQKGRKKRNQIERDK